MFDRVPPYSIEAEVAVLGGALIGPEAMAKTVEALRPEMFYREAHRRIYRAALALYQREENVEPIALAEELKERGELNAAGGYELIASLVDAVPSAANIEYHARIVRDKSTLRRLIAASEETIRDAHEPGERDVRALLDDAEARIMSIGDRGLETAGWAADIVWETLERIESYGQEGPPGLKTGFRDLDDMLSGGMVDGDLILVAARPSMGKTSFCMNVATHVAIEEKRPVAVFSLESTRQSLIERMIYSEARVSGKRIKMGKQSPSEWKRVARASQLVHEAPVWIDDLHSQSVMEMKAKARRIKSEKGDLGLIIVDYIQLIGSRGGSNDMTREQEIGSISRSLKGMAKELGVPVMALSQLSRSPERREDKRPILSDLRDSGSLEQDADVVMFLYRPEYYAEVGVRESLEKAAEVIIGKQREGEVGVVKLYFHKEYTRFESLDKRPG